MNKVRNAGFTLIEVIISLALLSIFLLLLSAILTLTSNISKSFLDYSNYEYAMMHKKIFEIYEDSEQVSIDRNKIKFINEKYDRQHTVIFSNSKIYKQTKNPGEKFSAGYSLLLEKINSYQFKKISEEIVSVKIIDKKNKEHVLKLRLKDEIKEREKNNSDESNKKNQDE
ncbi:prepilin-type N-terminal cleavage/methylation domain-containing protein [Gemella sp. zg-1178]|uniref:prepilin-type N-terminal cleavage/methylation domain-containing protein n=1 Tax=Gemella sp. zg-1178 TaxID=2840372 RepID=UPI001C05CDB1|nr:prepilin-type N-terminal cleavage/methylation domain-containing protein [Gemella sp. zg-1178]MBU0278920.1 prepilin-type N-terminal cleavage/methylation domain-containing protein [Gemella sp. zg-1178]